MDSSNIYSTDIEMVMDFMKLSLAYDDKNISDKERFDIIKLQKAILELLPVAQSNRISTIYGILADIYRKNKKEYVDHTKKTLFVSPPHIGQYSQPTRVPCDNKQVVQITTRAPQGLTGVLPQGLIRSSQSQGLATIPQKSINLVQPQQNHELLEKQKEDHVIALFYRATCPACQRIMGDWLEFKRQHKDSNFTVIDYDSEKPENKQIFQFFKIEFVPTIFKLTFDAQDKKKITTKMNDEINLGNLQKFANF